MAAPRGGQSRGPEGSMSVCLSVCISVCLSVYLSVCLSYLLKRNLLESGVSVPVVPGQDVCPAADYTHLGDVVLALQGLHYPPSQPFPLNALYRIVFIHIFEKGNL